MAYIFDFLSIMILYFTLFSEITIFCNNEIKNKITSYIFLKVFHFIICLFFYFNSKILCSQGILENLKNKDSERVKLLAVHISYIIIIIYQDISAIIFWIKEPEEAKAKPKKENKEDSFLEDWETPYIN